MIKKELIELLFDAASIQRWNDHNRPYKGFTELDKQAQKMVYAYLLAKFEQTDRNAVVNWRQLIEGGFFEFLRPYHSHGYQTAIFHKLMDEKGEQLNQWVIAQLTEALAGVRDNFWKNLKLICFSPNIVNGKKYSQGLIIWLLTGSLDWSIL